MTKETWPTLIDKGLAWHINFQFPIGSTHTIAINKETSECLLYTNGKISRHINDDLKNEIDNILTLMDEEGIEGGYQ